MCRALTQLGYEVHLATLPMGDDVAMSGLHCHRAARPPFVKHVPIGFSISKAVCDVTLAVKVLRLLGRHRFLAVHVIEEAVFFAVPLARLFGVFAVADLDSDICDQLRRHPSVLARGLAGCASTLRRIALRQSTCAITVAPPLTDIVTRISPGTKVFEISDTPVGTESAAPDSQTVERLRREFSLDVSCSVVYTGNFDARQGIETLVRAMPAVRVRISGARLLLVGGEPHEIRRVRTLARAARLVAGDRVRRKAAPRVDARLHGIGGRAGVAAPGATGYATQDLQLHGQRPTHRSDRFSDAHTGTR